MVHCEEKSDAEGRFDPFSCTNSFRVSTPVRPTVAFPVVTGVGDVPGPEGALPNDGVGLKSVPSQGSTNVIAGPDAGISSFITETIRPKSTMYALVCASVACLPVAV